MAFVLIIALVVVIAGAFSVRRKLRCSLSAQAFSDRSLYEQGKRASDEKRKGDVGTLGKVLQGAGIESAPMTWLMCVTAVMVAVVVFSFRAGGVLAAFLGAVFVCAGVVVYLQRAKKKRQKLLSVQFVRLLPQLSASVRSAQTVERAFRASVERAQEPLRSELVRVLAQVSYGESLVTALEDMARRCESEDIAAFAASMRIQQRFGGPVNKVIDLVGDHANARMKTQRELKTELAGTRLATWFVACAMPAIFGLMYAISSDFALFYRTEPLGWLVLAAAVSMEIAGVLACKKITTFRGIDAS